MARFGCLVALLCGACAPPLNVGTSGEAIVGGTNDTGDPAVVLVEYQEGLNGYLCTGELVSPHVVITAAHCVQMTTGKYHVFTGADYNTPKPGETLTVAEVHAHDGFDINAPQNGLDIGVVILAAPLAIQPLQMNRTPLDQAMVGMPVRFVGYGVTSGTDTMGTTAGVKRQTSSTVSSYNDIVLNFLDTRHMTCEGDSGGPAFMKLDGVTEVIVGLTSYGDAGCINNSHDTRMDLFADSWVQPYIDQFDPPPPMMSMNGNNFTPGATGATCTQNSDCNSNECALSGATGFCTQACDPKNDQCPTGTKCGLIGTDHVCLRSSTRGGCQAAPGEAPLTALLLMLALLWIRSSGRSARP